MQETNGRTIARVKTEYCNIENTVLNLYRGKIQIYQ